MEQMTTGDWMLLASAIMAVCSIIMGFITIFRSL